MDADAAFGWWTLFLIATVVLAAIAVALARPTGHRDLKGLGVFFGFLAALCAEIALVPLIVYFSWAWLYARMFGRHSSSGPVDLVQLVLGWKMHSHPAWLAAAGALCIAAGLAVLALAWVGLREARRANRLATTGVYRLVRHPQYLGFDLIMFGFVLQWPSLLTFIAFVLVAVAYMGLARDEEETLSALHGEEWTRYAQRTPRLIPFLHGGSQARA